VKNYPDAQVIFLDTPGIHRPLHRMNVRMVDTALDTIGEVDVLGQQNFLEVWNHERFVARLLTEPFTDDDARALSDFGI